MSLYFKIQTKEYIVIVTSSQNMNKNGKKIGYVCSHLQKPPYGKTYVMSINYQWKS